MLASCRSEGTAYGATISGYESYKRVEGKEKRPSFIPLLALQFDKSHLRES